MTISDDRRSTPSGLLVLSHFITDMDDEFGISASNVVELHFAKATELGTFSRLLDVLSHH